jgi:hypothetical protein
LKKFIQSLGKGIFWMIGSGHSVLLRKILKAKNDVEPKKLKNGHTYLPFELYLI